MCPHTAIYVSLTAVYVSSYCYRCVLILLYMSPHTAMYANSQRKLRELEKANGVKDKELHDAEMAKLTKDHQQRVKELELKMAKVS